MQDNTKKTLKIYWQHLLQYKLWVFLTISGVIGGAIFNISVPLYLKEFFNTLTASQPQEIIVKGLISILIIIAGLEIFQWIFWRIATFSASYFYSKVMTDLANYCFAYLHKHSFDFFNNNFVGSLVKRVKWFVNSFDRIMDRVTWNLVPLTVNVIAIILILSKQNWLLGAGIFVWTVLFLIINFVFTKYKLKYDILRSESETRATGFLADTITNHNNVKLFGGYRRELRKYAGANEELRRLRKFTWDLDNIFEAVQGGLMVALEIGILYLAIRLWQKGILTIGDFVLIQIYLLTIFIRIWDFGRVIRTIYESLADAEEMTAILNMPHEIRDAGGAWNLKVTKGKVEFKKVTFCYHKTRKVLKDFSLVVQPQERLALIGPSGAGKTTAIQLLLRVHDVHAGKIYIDGQKISRVTQESLRKNISLVPQDPILFHRSLMENIRYGKPMASDLAVIRAAKAAHCHEFIKEMPDGYNTYVGERGIKLSGGERQRVAIARAILRNAPILVLDEATSSLDSESERLIQDALDKLMKGKTVIVIAHRLSTIRRMNRIVVIDKGEIVEEGTHRQLLEKKRGLYKKLWKLQVGGFIR